MSLCIQYTDPDTKVLTIQKGFLRFVAVLNLSDSCLVSVILKDLK